MKTYRDRVRKPFGDYRDGLSLRRLLNLYDCLVVRFSGGKDSIASFLRVRDLWAGPADKLIVVHGSIPIDWPDAGEYLDYLESVLKHPIVRIAKFGDDSMRAFEERLEKWGYPGANRWCTSTFKVSPLEGYVHKLLRSGRRVLSIYGNRAQESRQRAAQRPRGLWNGRDFVFPIYKWSTEKVLESIDRQGVKLHHSYAQGERMGCPVCGNRSAGEWDMLRKRYPKIWEQGVHWYGRSLKADNYRKGGIAPNHGLKILSRCSTCATRPLTADRAKLWFPNCKLKDLEWVA